jgi:MscS family membrane protein
VNAPSWFPGGESTWPWLVGALTVAAAAIAGLTLARVIRAGLHRATRRSAIEWDDELADALGGPLGAGLAVIALWHVLPMLPLAPRASSLVRNGVVITGTAVVLWLAFRIIDVGHGVMRRRAWAVAQPAARSLLALAARLIKVVLLVITLITGLAVLGLPVASLIAGLGIGGLALALAAQKTVENLFGTLSIGVDQPFREGDFVRIGDVLGTVEAIGLRSTRVRTLDRTVVTIPNGQLADTGAESLTARDRMRLACIVGLIYETTGAQMRAILADLEQVLRAHPKIWPDAVVVKFKEFGQSSLDVEIMAWFQTEDWGEFQGIRQEILLAFMDVVERHGSSFAFPTRTLHIASGPAAPAAR